MALGTFVEIAIGLASIYLIASLIASAIQETIAGFLQWRGKYFAKAVESLVTTGAATSFGFDSRQLLKMHLTSGAPKSPDTVAALQINNVTKDQATALAQLSQIHTHPLLQGTALPSYVDSKDFAMALLDVLKDGSSAPLFNQAEATIAKLPDGDLKRVLVTFVHDAGGDLDQLRDSIAHWFDNAMDRVGGIYKRFSNYVMLVLGVVLAILLNIDTVRITRTLWEQPATRAAIVANAQASTPASDAKLTDLLAQLAAQPLPIARKADDDFFGNPATADSDGKLRIPAPPRTNPLSVIVGWLMTAFAISLGAPFWFDLLGKILNVRAAGPKPKDNSTT